MKPNGKKRKLRNCIEKEGCDKGRNGGSLVSLKAIIDDYKEQHQKNLENYLLSIAQGTVLDCVAGRLNKQPLPDDSTVRYFKHPHQRRFTNERINEASSKFEEVVNNQFTSFDELYEVVNKSKPKGIGPVTVYDFSIRYGGRLGLLPDEYVYIHAGTSKGLEALSDSKSLKRRHKILKSELPEELQHIASIDIENLLCIYKEELKQISK